MDSRDLFLLAIVEQAVAMGILLVGAWILTRRDQEQHRLPMPPLSEAAAGPQQPYLVFSNGLRRPMEAKPAVPAVSANKRISADVRTGGSGIPRNRGAAR